MQSAALIGHGAAEQRTAAGGPSPRIVVAVAVAVSLHALLLLGHAPGGTSTAPRSQTMVVRWIPAATQQTAAAAAAQPASLSTTTFSRPEPSAPTMHEVRPPMRNAAERRALLRPVAEAPIVAGNAQPVTPGTAPPSSAPPSGHALADAPDYLLAKLLSVGPRPLEEIEPAYPEGADLRTGKVVLRVLISEAGHVDDVAVVRASPPGLFDASAIEAFSKARFSPGLLGGVAVKSQITVEVEFVPLDRLSRISGRSY